MIVDRRAEYGVWKAKGWGLTVKYARSVLEDIQAVFTKERVRRPESGDIAGVLFGKKEGDVLHILAFRPLDCAYPAERSDELPEEYRTAFTRLFEKAESDEQLKGLAVLGWYRSVDQSGCSDLDFETYLRYFPEPWQITMLFEVASERITNLGFLFRDSYGSIRAAFDHPSIPPYLLAQPPNPKGGLGKRNTMALAALASAVALAVLLFRPSGDDVPSPYQEPGIENSRLTDASSAIPSLPEVTTPYKRLSTDLEPGVLGRDFRDAATLPPRQRDEGLASDDLPAAASADAAVPERRSDPPQPRTEVTSAPPRRQPEPAVSARPPDEPTRPASSAEAASPAPQASGIEDRTGRPQESSPREQTQDAGPAGVTSPPPPNPVQSVRAAGTSQQQLNRLPAASSLLQVDPPTEVASLLPRSEPPPSPTAPPRPQPAPAETANLTASLPSVVEKLRPEPAYHGPTSGTVIWTGQLTRNGVVRIQGASASQGYVSGELPAVPLTIRAYPAELSSEGITVYTTNPEHRTPVTKPASAENGWNKTAYKWSPNRAQSITVIEAPNPLNNWSQLIIRSDSSNVALILVEWEVSQPNNTTARNR